MSINKLYESVEGGLDRIIKRLTESSLLEKKQEISPEDERDNELIRSAMKKRQNRFNAKLTKEEQDALARNNFRAEKRDFVTPNGYIEVGSYGQPRIRHKSYDSSYGDKNATIFPETRVKIKDPTKSRYAHDNREYYEYPANINLANLGRKQAERKDTAIRDVKPKTYYGYGDYNNPNYEINRRGWFTPERGAKKSYKGVDIKRHDNWRDRDYTEPAASLNYEGNFKNRLDAERYEQNQRLQKNVDSLKSKMSNRTSLKKKRSEVFGNTDNDRQTYMKEIEKYKQLLRDLDEREERQLAGYDDEINAETTEIRDFLDKLKNKKNKKTESLNRNKRYKHI